MTNPRILLIDDDAGVTSIVGTFLIRTSPYDIREENCASEAVAVAREYRPDVVILDLNMAGKTGAEVAGELAADPELKAIPLIFLSGFIPAGYSGFRNGVVYLTKPFDLKMLRVWIDTLLENAPAPHPKPANTKEIIQESTLKVYLRSRQGHLA